MISVPVIGQWLAFLLLGGDIPNPLTVPRLYSLHIFLIPAVIAILIALHLGSVWWRCTPIPRPRPHQHHRLGSRLWPSYAAKSLGLFCLLFALIAMLGGLVQIDPVWVYGPYDPPPSCPEPSRINGYLGW